MNKSCEKMFRPKQPIMPERPNHQLRSIKIKSDTDNKSDSSILIPSLDQKFLHMKRSTIYRTGPDFQESFLCGQQVVRFIEAMNTTTKY